jgi:hypothetical protein
MSRRSFGIEGGDPLERGRPGAPITVRRSNACRPDEPAYCLYGVSMRFAQGAPNRSDAIELAVQLPMKWIGGARSNLRIALLSWRRSSAARNAARDGMR